MWKQPHYLISDCWKFKEEIQRQINTNSCNCDSN